MGAKETLENVTHLVCDLTVKNNLVLEKADLFSTFVGMLKYAILADKKIDNDEPVSLMVITDDTDAKKRMYEFVKLLFDTSEFTRMVSNELIWTNSIHIHFLKARVSSVVGYRIDYALIDISTENGQKVYRNTFPVVASNPNGKCVMVEEALY